MKLSQLWEKVQRLALLISKESFQTLTPEEVTELAELRDEEI